MKRGVIVYESTKWFVVCPYDTVVRSTLQPRTLAMNSDKIYSVMSATNIARTIKDRYGPYQDIYKFKLYDHVPDQFHLLMHNNVGEPLHTLPGLHVEYNSNKQYKVIEVHKKLFESTLLVDILYNMGT